jgi:hypothetical protein
LHQAPGLADENGNNGELPKIVVGVCAMDRKVGWNLCDIPTSAAASRDAALLQ